MACELALVPIKVVKRVGQSVVVEWTDEDGTWRTTLPAEVVQDSEIYETVLFEGASYGVLWDSYIDVRPFSKEAIYEGLKRAGIWTMEDMRLNAAKALKVFQRIAGGIFNRMLQEAERDNQPPRRSEP